MLVQPHTKVHIVDPQTLNPYNYFPNIPSSEELGVESSANYTQCGVERNYWESIRVFQRRHLLPEPRTCRDISYQHSILKTQMAFDRSNGFGLLPVYHTVSDLRAICTTRARINNCMERNEYGGFVEPIVMEAFRAAFAGSQSISFLESSFPDDFWHRPEKRADSWNGGVDAWVVIDGQIFALDFVTEEGKDRIVQNGYAPIRAAGKIKKCQGSQQQMFTSAQYVHGRPADTVQRSHVIPFFIPKDNMVQVTSMRCGTPLPALANALNLPDVLELNLKMATKGSPVVRALTGEFLQAVQNAAPKTR